MGLHGCPQYLPGVMNILDNYIVEIKVINFMKNYFKYQTVV